MIIHTVQPGETVLSIARKYATSAVKLMEYNDSACPDRLLVGQQLLILTPTRTVTVRGGDALADICRRFDVRKSTLYANNPALCARASVYPGEELAVRFDTPGYGKIASNGYAFAGCTAHALQSALPYLTFVTLCECRTQNGKVFFSSAQKKLLALAKQAGKRTLMRVTPPVDDTEAEDENGWCTFIREVICVAEAEGFDGITLASSRIQTENTSAFGARILRARRELLGHGLILFTESACETHDPAADLADGNVIVWNPRQIKNAPSFEEGVVRRCASYAEVCESSKAFLALDAFGYDEECAYTQQEILDYGYKYKAEIKNNPDTLLATLCCPHYVGERRQTRCITFAPCSYILAKLKVLDCYGYMGAAFDIAHTPVSTRMLLQVLFGDVLH